MNMDHGGVIGCGLMGSCIAIGLDTTLAVADALYEELKQPLFAAPPLLARIVDVGLFGREPGRGFDTYLR